MRDMLVPIFGEWGAVVAQFLLTVVIVLALIGAVWWFVRRYSRVHIGGIGRGRVPRLAMIDALPVDRRRRLVLVRRDNVEHLLLIGGPSDVVVEGTIHRVRQRGPQQAAQLAAARAALQTPIEPPPAAETDVQPAEEAAGTGEPSADAPIPFPVARSAPRPAAFRSGRAEVRPVQPLQAPAATIEDAPAAAPVATATFVEPQRPTRLQPQEPTAGYEPTPPNVAEEPAAELLLSEVMTADAAPPAPSPEPETPPPATFAEAEQEAAEAARQSALDLGDMEAPETAMEGETAPVGTANKVSDLEREMARLLDEITTRRST